MIIKHCARCIIPTIDPEAGVFAGKEPLKYTHIDDCSSPIALGMAADELHVSTGDAGTVDATVHHHCSYGHQQFPYSPPYREQDRKVGSNRDSERGKESL
jgi:hypothetical protein